MRLKDPLLVDVLQVWARDLDPHCLLLLGGSKSFRKLFLLRCKILECRTEEEAALRQHVSGQEQQRISLRRKERKQLAGEGDG